MKKTDKRGFTIVELVIVIAVIAILAAVLIPTFSNIIKSANESADSQLVRNLNTAVSTELAATGKEKATTAYEALTYAKMNGYDISVIVAKSDNNIAWSRDTGAFVLIDTTAKTAIYPTTNGTEELTVENKEVNYFLIVAASTDAAKGYSIYAGEGWKETSVELNGVGFDAGDSPVVTTVNYKNDTSNAKDVVIRTNSDKTKLSITVYEEGTAGSSDYKCDNVKVYGLTGELDVINGGQASVHTYGNVGFATVKEGKLIAEAGKVEAAYIPDSSATVAVNENGGEVTIVYVKVEGDKTTVVNNNKTNVEADDVKWIYADATAASADTNGTKVTEKAKEASLTAGNDLVLQENANYVARVNTTGYELIDDAVAACKSGDTIYLLADKTYTNNTYLYIGDRDFKINLSGCTIKNISPDLNWSSSALIVDYAYDSYITNGTFISINGSGIYAADGNKCVVENCIASSLAEDLSGGYGAALRVTENSKMTVNGGTYTGYQALCIDCSGGEYVINGGTFNGKVRITEQNQGDNPFAKLTINDGVFNCSFELSGGAKQTIVINGGTFTIPAEQVNAIKGYVASGKTITINGESYTKE